MLYLVVSNGEPVVQSLGVIRNYTKYPFKVKCLKSNNTIPFGFEVKVTCYKYGSYMTESGSILSAKDPIWTLVG